MSERSVAFTLQSVPFLRPSCPDWETDRNTVG